MITPKEKALELVHKYIDLTGGWVAGTTGWKYKKQCALIAVEELIQQEESHNNGSFYPNDYWKKVKQELEIL